MRCRRLILPLLALSAAASAGAFQPFDRSNEGVTRRYIAESRDDLGKREAIISARGLIQELAGMRAIVRSHMKPVGGQPGISAASKAALNDVFIDRTAVQLVELGRSVQEVQGLQQRGFDVVRLVAGAGPSPSLLGPAAFSGDVVVGEIVSVATEAGLGDGRLTSITFRAVETLAGTMKRGERVIIRLGSGCRPDGQCMSVSTEPDVRSLKAGERYLLFPSAAAYAQQARMKGFALPTRGRYALNMAELIKIDGDRLLPTHGYPGGTLAGARAELTPFARAQAEVRQLQGQSGTGGIRPR